MGNYNRIPRLVPGQQAIRQAFGMIGYASEYGAIKPDLAAWIADGMDLISPLKTYTEIPCLESEVCDNRIKLPNEVAIITCASANGNSMTYLPAKGCDRVGNNYNQNNRCGCSAQGFRIQGCYMTFKPMLGNGAIVCIDGLGRPLDEDDFPMIEECCILAISEYLASRIALRFRDNRFPTFEALWLNHVNRARAELNQLSNEQVKQLGYFWYKQPVFATFFPGWLGNGYSGGSLANSTP